VVAPTIDGGVIVFLPHRPLAQSDDGAIRYMKIQATPVPRQADDNPVPLDLISTSGQLLLNASAAGTGDEDAPYRPYWYSARHFEPHCMFGGIVNLTFEAARVGR
jgi:hypothetical protein